jgi:fimbrial chaperone protein
MAWRIITFASMSLMASWCRAAELAVLPIGVTLGPGHERAAVSVTNYGAQSVLMQVEAVSWTQVQGEDRYVPTTDLVVNPPLFSVQPGRAQAVRLGLRKSPDPTRETAYRLLLREVPAMTSQLDGAGASLESAVRVLLQFRLPIYVAPAAPVRSAQWHAQRDADGSLKLEATNTGNTHLVVTELALRSQDAAADSPALMVLTTSTPIFPGQGHQWRLQPDRPLPEQLRLDVNTDREVQHVQVAPGGG